jgi:hypothetical protein
VDFHKEGPFFWFSAPALLDEVKHFFCALVHAWSTGGQMEAIRVKPML